MKGGEKQNEAMVIRRQGTTETQNETKTQSQNGETIKTSKSEEEMKRWWDVDKMVGESRFWQIVGAIMLIATLYFIIFQLGGK